MNYFDYSLEKLNEYEQVRDCLSRKKSCQVTGCGDSQLAHFINGLSNGYKQKVIVTFSAIKAKELYDDMKGFTDDVVMYPAKDLIFFSADVHGSYILQQRLEFIQKVVENKPFTVIVTVDAFLDKIQPLEKIKDNYIEIGEGSIVEMDALKTKLAVMGYQAVTQIDSPGQFAIRGSILDIYTLTDETPYRIDFWDDEVDIIKSFDVESQRSIENIESVKIYPASEYFLDKKTIEDVRIAYGVAGPVPMRAPSAEQVAKGKPVTKEVVEEFAKAVLEDINPRDSWRAAKDFRKHIAVVLAKRALTESIRLAGGEIDE